jgi:hypothetical protein
LPGLHRELWIHAGENFFTPLPIHGCQVAHQPVARSPFRILAQTDADCQKRGDDPNSDICRGHERNKEANRVSDNPTAVIQPSASGMFRSHQLLRNRTERGSMRNYSGGLRRRLHRVITKNVFSRDRSIEASPGN